MAADNWEYTMASASDENSLMYELRKLGEEGWEAVSMSVTSVYHRVLLKRLVRPRAVKKKVDDE